MITLFEKFNFRIINKNWSEPNKDDINKYKLYSEFIINMSKYPSILIY